MPAELQKNHNKYKIYCWIATKSFLLHQNHDGSSNHLHETSSGHRRGGRGVRGVDRRQVRLRLRHLPQLQVLWQVRSLYFVWNFVIHKWVKFNQKISSNKLESLKKLHMKVYYFAPHLSMIWDNVLPPNHQYTGWFSRSRTLVGLTYIWGVPSAGGPLL